LKESGNGGKLELRRVFAHEKPQELDECPTPEAHFMHFKCGSWLACDGHRYLHIFLWVEFFGCRGAAGYISVAAVTAS
uniref:hypothetical protein n=1 Tax=Pseudomonas sp. AU10 TaxID=882697 RepID=UPI0021E26DEA